MHPYLVESDPASADFERIINDMSMLALGKYYSIVSIACITIKSI